MADSFRPVALVPTGVVALDHAIGGGIPAGKSVEIYGPYKGGKTFLALEIVRAYIGVGAEALWFDSEHALDEYVPGRIGIDPKLCQYDPDPPHTIEEFVEKTESWLDGRKKNKLGVVALDSVACLSTKHEMETPMDRRSLDRAGLIYKAFRRLSGPLSRTGTTLVFVNQIRERIGVVFGNPETTTGGKGPEFFASLRLRVSQGVLSKKKVRVLEDERPVGVHTLVYVEKNRLMPDGQKVELLLRYETGFDATHGALRLLVSNGLLHASEDKDDFEYKGKAIADENAFVDEHPELFREIWRRYRGNGA
jgi:recombination protein RecA